MNRAKKLIEMFYDLREAKRSSGPKVKPRYWGCRTLAVPNKKQSTVRRRELKWTEWPGPSRMRDRNKYIPSGPKANVNRSNEAARRVRQRDAAQS